MAGLSAGYIRRIESEFFCNWTKPLVHWSTNTVEQPVHHLEGRGDRDGSFGDRGSTHSGERVAGRGRLGGQGSGHGVGQRDELSAKVERRRVSARHRGDVEVKSGGFATRTEKRSVGKQSIETLVEVRRASGHELDLGSGQFVGV